MKNVIANWLKGSVIDVSKNHYKLILHHLTGHLTVFNPGEVRIFVDHKVNQGNCEIYDQEGEKMREYDDVDYVCMKMVSEKEIKEEGYEISD